MTISDCISYLQNAFAEENLTSVNNQIPQPIPGSDELSDHHSHQTEPDIYLHDADNQRDRGGQDDLEEGVLFCAVEGIDQLDFVFAGF